MVGAGIFTSSISDVLHLLAIIVSFFLGASLSGFLLHDSQLKLGINYEVALLIESAFLLISVYFLKDGSLLGHYFASAACGLQNAMVTTYSGAIVRTTHVTGIFTDLGIMLGAKLRGKAFDKRKAILLLIIVTGFISGGTIGAFLFVQYHFYALGFPCFMCFFIAICYRVYANKN